MPVGSVEEDEASGGCVCRGGGSVVFGFQCWYRAMGAGFGWLEGGFSLGFFLVDCR